VCQKKNRTDQRCKPRSQLICDRYGTPLEQRLGLLPERV
jgi:hypothetical protein